LFTAFHLPLISSVALEKEAALRADRLLSVQTGPIEWRPLRPLQQPAEPLHLAA
jgi:hypothetical protein